MKKLLLLISFFFLALSACEDESQSPISEEEQNVSQNYRNGFFVVNEGNFSWGKATLSFVHQNGKVENNIYENQHQEALGNVAQSMNIHNDKGYIVVNNSQKIEVINPQKLERLATISGLRAPRYFIGVDDRKGYVTTIYENLVYVIDLEKNEVQKTIQVNNWTERMARMEEYVIVCSHDGFEVWIINTQTDQIESTIKTAAGPKWVVADHQNQKVWVLSTGNDSTPAEIIAISLPDLSTENRFEFDEGKRPQFLSLFGDELFWIENNRLYKMPTVSDKLPSNPLIAQLGLENTLIYNAVISPSTGNLLFADAIDYLQEGYIFEYDIENKTELNRYRVGVIPNDFCFVGD